jgi:hypothetical protein
MESTPNGEGAKKIAAQDAEPPKRRAVKVTSQVSRDGIASLKAQPPNQAVSLLGLALAFWAPLDVVRKACKSPPRACEIGLKAKN